MVAYDYDSLFHFQFAIHLRSIGSCQCMEYGYESAGGEYMPEVQDLLCFSLELYIPSGQICFRNAILPRPSKTCVYPHVSDFMRLGICRRLFGRQSISSVCTRPISESHGLWIEYVEMVSVGAFEWNFWRSYISCAKFLTPVLLFGIWAIVNSYIEEIKGLSFTVAWNEISSQFLCS